MYVYLISLGSISVRFCFSISCMISVHSLSHGSSSAFLYDQFTRPLIWFLLCFPLALSSDFLILNISLIWFIVTVIEPAS